MADFTTRRNDTKPLTAELLDTNGDPVNLDGTVTFTMTGPDGLTTKKVNRGSVTITSAVLGRVSYAWQSGETSTAGLFQGQFEAVYGDGTKETFPAQGSFTVQINADLDEV